MYKVNSKFNDPNYFQQFVKTHSDSKKVKKFIEQFDEYITKNDKETDSTSFSDNQTKELTSHLSKIKHNITYETLSELFYMVWVTYDGENRNELFGGLLSFLETRIKVDNSDEEFTVFRVGTIDGRSWSQNLQSLTLMWNTWIDYDNEFTNRKRKFLQPRVYKRVIKKSDIT